MPTRKAAKPLIDLDKLHLDVRRLAAGEVPDDDPYLKMMAGIPPDEEALFLDTVRHDDHGLDWMDAWRVVMDGKILDDDVQGAMAVCCFAVERLKAHVETLAMALGAAKPRIARTVKADDTLPEARKKKAEYKATRDKPIMDAVKKRMDDNKGDSLHSARQHVADQQGISFDAVKRATVTLKPRKKMKK